MNRNTLFADDLNLMPNNERGILELLVKPRIDFIEKNYLLVIETINYSMNDIRVSTTCRYESCFDDLNTTILNFTNRVINGCNNEDITSLMQNISQKLTYINRGGASVGQCAEAHQKLIKLFNSLKLALEQGAVLAKERAIHDAIKSMHPPTKDLVMKKSNGCTVL